MHGTVQDPGTSRAAGGFKVPREDSSAARWRTGSAAGRPPYPQPGTTRTSQPIVLKDGDPIPPGYTYMPRDRADPPPTARTQLRSACDTVDLSTPPKATEAAAGGGPDRTRSKANARRNLTRNLNRKANATFAKEMKDSLASGRPTEIAVAVEQTDLKGAWHTAAKEVAYKLLDLRKESWKDYSIFDKAKVHKEIATQYKYEPPLDPKRIDKYLSGHLRTQRAVWKAHWKRHGASKRHHNCPEEAWEKLTAWWPTGRCQEESADMASRRAMVENRSTVGRSSLMDRMDVQVRKKTVMYAL